MGIGRGCTKEDVRGTEEPENTSMLGRMVLAIVTIQPVGDEVYTTVKTGDIVRIHQEDAENTYSGSRIGEREIEGGYAMRKRNTHVGSSLDEFLKEEGILAETRAIALKDATAGQVQKTMEKEKTTQVEMARRMRTSRAALDRLLAPGNASVTLQTLTSAAVPWAAISGSNWCNRASGYYNCTLWR
jgi:antitoxin HicB